MIKIKIQEPFVLNGVSMVWMDIFAPLYWWNEFEMHKSNTIINEYSYMDNITDKEFELEDFSYDRLYNGPGFHLLDENERDTGMTINSVDLLQLVINYMNDYREAYLQTESEECLLQIIQLLPSSFNQEQRVSISQKELINICEAHQSSKLSEWVDFCKACEELQLWIRI